MKHGDRVSLSQNAAAMQRRKAQITDANRVDWDTRQGVVMRLHGNGVHIGVQWEDRRYIDWWPKGALRVVA